MTIHDTKDLRVEIEDDAVSLFLYGGHVVTMTVGEWREINVRVEAAEGDK